jgi:arylsulfatase A-like enzyme
VPDKDLDPYLAMKWNDPPFVRAKGGYTPHFTPRAAYAAMISKLDTQVGEIVDLVDELGLGEDTIIVFTSDNGATHLHEEVDVDFFNSVGDLRGLKGELYEGGIRVPQIARWKGTIAPGSTSERVIGFEDWLPTILDLVGAATKIPADIDGISFAETVRGETQVDRPFLYREFPSYGGQQAVWLGQRWKGIRTGLKKKGVKADLTVQLYDLVADPPEALDVAAENPDVVARIEALMASERVPSTAFPFPALDGLSAK